MLEISHRTSLFSGLPSKRDNSDQRVAQRLLTLIVWSAVLSLEGLIIMVFDVGCVLCKSMSEEVNWNYFVTCRESAHQCLFLKGRSGKYLPSPLYGLLE